MSKLWGPRKPNDSEHLRSSQMSRPRDPDERTSLLPPQNRHHPLNPDDPAVSPYNLLSVRSLRWASIFLLMISLLWWVVLLISQFVSPPGIYSRGSGFLDFAFSTLATGSLILLLLFFATPSKSEQYSWVILSVFLFIDTVIILAVPRVRGEEGWVGIVSVLWATVISAWGIICDRVVAYGKREEEERLTGRRETRRSLAEWLSVFSSTIILITFTIIAFLFTGTLLLRSIDTSLAPPGTRYWVGGHRYEIHIFCIGNATTPDGERVTTVLVEGGEDPVKHSIEGWVLNAYQDKKIERYCYWDRPGLGFSENSPSPLSAGMAIDILLEALMEAGENGPWLLVSHGVGGIYSRIFASRRTAEVKGLLLIDTLPESQLHRIGSAGRGFVLWLRGVISPLGIDRLTGAIFMGRGRADRTYGRSAYQSGKQIKAKLQENLVATTFTKNEITAAKAILPKDIPVAVVSSGKSIKHDQQWNSGQRELTEITENLVAWDVVNHAPHDVWNSIEGGNILLKRLGQLLYRG